MCEGESVRDGWLCSMEQKEYEIVIDYLLINFSLTSIIWVLFFLFCSLFFLYLNNSSISGVIQNI